MKRIIKLEELGLFLLGVYLFSQLHFAWWWFLVLILTPDFAMIGYLVNSKVGAWAYNVFHHRGIAICLYLSGIYLASSSVQLTGIILFAHASMDRIFGYGLKYESGFKFTHLGEIGQKQNT